MVPAGRTAVMLSSKPLPLIVVIAVFAGMSFVLVPVSVMVAIAVMTNHVVAILTMLVGMVVLGQSRSSQRQADRQHYYNHPKAFHGALPVQVLTC
jgi:ABC-type transport system involved in cytochrome bd biosynthesis fused ATPase/permease subunit